MAPWQSSRIDMGRSRSWLAVSAILAALSAALQGVNAHVFLMEPVSRNFYYTSAFQRYDWPGITYCPHCYQSRGPMAVRARAEENTPADVLKRYGDGDWPLRAVYNYGELANNGNYLEPQEISVRHGICGDPEQTKAEGSNVFGRENSVYPVLKSYDEGDVIELKVVVSTFHWGHLEYFICNQDDLADGEDSVVTQECFNRYPLTRAPDDTGASPIDPNHPGRYFLDPPCRAAETDQNMADGANAGYLVTGRYVLPAGLSCERCTLQMIYYTGNACRHPGYEEFIPETLPDGCAPRPTDWIHLDPPPCGEGFPYPEEFWNCADIAITPGSSGPTNPAPSPVPSPEPTPAPTAPKVPVVTNSCLDKTSDNYRCTGAGDAVQLKRCGLTDADLPDMRQCFEDFGLSKIERIFLRKNDMSTLPASLFAGIGNLTKLDVRFNCGLSCVPASVIGVNDLRFSNCNNAANQECESSPSPTPTPEPTPAPTEKRDPCSIRVDAWGQCGGNNWEGSTCCDDAYECTVLAESYHQCQLQPYSGSCSGQWEQCGGSSWSGSECCAPGTTCEFRNEGYSQCIPNANLSICSTILVPSDAI